MSERAREILERLAEDLDAHPGDERPALEDPADSRPCGCEEVEGLRAQLDRVVALANRWEKHQDYALFRSFAHALQVAIEGEEAPPPAPPPSRVTLLEEIAEGVVDMLDGEPSGSDSLDWALEQYGYKPTKGVTEEQYLAQQAAAEALTVEPWRVGTRIPEHVYIGDRPLVTMPTAELAALVVTAVNGYGAALARIADLEDMLQDAHGDRDHWQDSHRGLETRIARAVAELKRGEDNSPTSLSLPDAIERALEALR